MKLFRSITLVLSTVLAAAMPVRAVDSTPLTRDTLLTSLSQEVAAHFNLEGDLQLELLRAWTPPSRVATAWNISVLEYPAVPSASMLLRCRVLADGETAAET